jgi:phage tail-like protein
MTGEEKDSNWPLPKFYFKVDLGSTTDVPFQEVSGLEVTAQPIEYRLGNSPVFSTINMPGIVKNNNVTLKKGVFVKDNKFFDWYTKIKMNTVERQNVVIKLCDEGGNPTMTWTLTNAWPTKISSTDMKSDANEVAVETIEISHEGLTIANG